MGTQPVQLDFSKAVPIQPPPQAQSPAAGVTLDFSKAQPIQQPLPSATPTAPAATATTKPASEALPQAIKPEGIEQLVEQWAWQKIKESATPPTPEPGSVGDWLYKNVPKAWDAVQQSIKNYQQEKGAPQTQPAGPTTQLPKEAQPFAQSIQKWAQQYNVRPDVLAAQLVSESSGNPAAVGKSKPEPERGLMQIMPGTWRSLAQKNPALGDFEQNAFDPDKNIQAGAMYVRQLLDEHNQSYDEAIPHYNAAKNVEAGQKYLRDVYSHIGRASVQQPSAEQTQQPQGPAGGAGGSWDTGKITSAELDAYLKAHPIYTKEGLQQALGLMAGGGIQTIEDLIAGAGGIASAMGARRRIRAGQQPASTPAVPAAAPAPPEPEEEGEQFTSGFGPQPAERPQPQKPAEGAKPVKPAEAGKKAETMRRYQYPSSEKRTMEAKSGGVVPSKEEDLEDLLKQSLKMVQEKRAAEAASE